MHAFYEPDGDGFLATSATRGPWAADAQHGGPPTALLVRAAERAFPELVLARITVELIRPVPLGRGAVALTVDRSGRRTTQLSATFLAQDQPCMHAKLLMVRPTEVALPPLPAPALPTPIEDCRPFSFPFFTTDEGYHRAVEIRISQGEFGRGDLAGWMRPIVPLVAGEATSPAQAAAIVCDAGSGLGLLLDTQRYTFVNADLTIHLLRPPHGNAVHMHAVTTAAPGGRGLCTTALADAHGPLGQAVQSLVLAAR